VTDNANTEPKRKPHNQETRRPIVENSRAVLFAQNPKIIARRKPTMARQTRSEKITGIDNEIAQLLAQKKALLQEQKAEERKARTNRLCKRAGHLESLLPDTIALTDARFNLFLSKTMVTDFAKRELRKLLDEQALESEIVAEERAKEAITAETPKPAPQAAENSIAGMPDAAAAQTAVVAAKARQSAAAQPADSATASPQAAVNTAQTQRLPNNANANRQTA
jgi:hypothetical protein